MDIDILLLYALAVIAPIMIFATRYVVKGRSRDMTRLWFISFFSYTVYYWLAKSYDYYVDPQDVVYAFAFLWPIAAILSFWLAEKLTEKGTPVPSFKWIVYFLVAAAFAFLLEGAAGIMQWYTYNSDKLDVTPFINPLSGTAMPALMPFLLGLLMIGVFFLVFNVHKLLKKKRIGETSATLLLGALSVVMVGLVWVVSDLLLGYAKGLL